MDEIPNNVINDELENYIMVLVVLPALVLAIKAMLEVADVDVVA